MSLSISSGPIASAIAWLRAELHDGPRGASAITASAQQHGIAERSLRSACRELQVVKQRTGFGRGGRWTWSLPIQQMGSNEIASVNESERKTSLRGQGVHLWLTTGCCCATGRGETRSDSCCIDPYLDRYLDHYQKRSSLQSNRFFC